MSEEILLTREGLEKIKEELEYKNSIGRKEVAEKLKEARSHGDLSENAEYDAAKEEYANLEDDIRTLEDKIRRAKIIEENSGTGDSVSIGNVVVIRDEEDGLENEYKIVGSSEADPIEGKISNDSPVGSALLGHKEGDTVEVMVLDKTIKYTVIKIEK